MLLRSALVLATMLLAHEATAQTIPKTITIVVPFAPGASADSASRILATELGPRLGATFVIDNKPGAGGSIGVSHVAKSAPDGATLGISAPSALVVSPFVPSSPTPNVLPSLAPVAKLVNITNVLVASPATGIKSVKDLVDKSKQRPEGLSFGSPGSYSLQHFSAEMLKKATGANLVHVVYRGSAPAVADVLGGTIPLASVDLASALPQIEAGKLVAVGVTTTDRSQIAPNIALLSEAVPQYKGAAAWFGLFAPRGTPAPIVAQLNRELEAVLAAPGVQDKLKGIGLESSYQNAAAFGSFLDGEVERWKLAIKELPAAQ